MKATIRGVIYDTKKSVKIGEVDGLLRMEETDEILSFGKWRAGLYRTSRSGRYFLAGIGGMFTIFYVPPEHNKRYKVIPIEPEEAKCFARSFLDKDALKAEFGE